MSHSESSPSLLGRARAFYRLLNRLIDANHDYAALDHARTLLDRGERPFASDPALDRRAGIFCPFSEFASILQLQKTIEDWEGAALDGGPPETAAQRARRFGNDGMPLRRRALAQAMLLQAHRSDWAPRFASVFAAPERQWRWRPSGWRQDFVFEDGPALLFQPIVIVIAPSAGLLLRAATILEQLCPPPAHVPAAVRQGAALPRMAYAGALLLESAAENPPEVEEFARHLIALRRTAARSGWPVGRIEILVLGGDPVSVALAHWAHLGHDARDFAPAWQAAEDAGATLAPLYRAATDPAAAQRLVEKLTGDAPAVFADPAPQPVRSTENDGVRCTLARVENLHQVARRLLENAGVIDPEAEVMDRARLVQTVTLFAPEFCLPPARTLPAETLAAAGAQPLPQRLFSAEESAAILHKWSTPGAAEEGEVFVFPHIPKTAGSSVHYHLKTNLEYDRAYVHIPIDYTSRQELRERTPFPLRDRRERAHARVLFGHGIIRRHAALVPGKIAREITTLRDPVDRTVSHYNFWMNVLEKRGQKPVPFDVWYAGEPRNYHLHWLARNYLELDPAASEPAALYERVAAMLEGFWLVCTIPTFEADIQRLFDALQLPPMKGRQNVGGVTHAVRFEADAALRERLEADNALDFKLYRHWLERAQSRHAAAAPAGGPA